MQMRTKTKFMTLAIVIIALLAMACRNSGASGSDKVIKSVKEGDLTITLSSATGELRSGDNDLRLSFADGSGKLVDVGAASLKLFMPGMGTMPEMNDVATLTTTDTPGKYRAQLNIEVAGTWEARIGFEGPHGTGQARMNVQAK